MIFLTLILVTSALACNFENPQICKNLEHSSQDSNALLLLRNALKPESTFVDVISNISVLQDDMRKKKKASHSMLVDQELSFELFERELANERRKNQVSEQLIKMKLEKFFVPRKQCFEQIMYHLENLKPLVNNLNQENQLIYISIRDQLQQQSACYSLLGRMNDKLVDTFTREEAEQYNADEQFQGVDWEDIFSEIINLDIVHNQNWLDINTSFEKVYNYFVPFFSSSAKYNKIYEAKLSDHKEKDLFFRQQMQFNREALKQESDNNHQIKELYDQELHILEVIKSRFMAELEPDVREQLIRKARSIQNQNNEQKQFKRHEGDSESDNNGEKKCSKKQCTKSSKKQQDFIGQVHGSIFTFKDI